MLVTALCWRLWQRESVLPSVGVRHGYASRVEVDLPRAVESMQTADPPVLGTLHQAGVCDAFLFPKALPHSSLYVSPSMIFKTRGDKAASLMWSAVHRGCSWLGETPLGSSLLTVGQ